MKLGKSILEYAREFNVDFEFRGGAPNRKKHIPYVLKALNINDVEIIGDLIIINKVSKSQVIE